MAFSTVFACLILLFRYWPKTVTPEHTNVQNVLWLGRRHIPWWRCSLPAPFVPLFPLSRVHSARPSHREINCFSCHFDNILKRKERHHSFVCLNHAECCFQQTPKWCYWWFIYDIMDHHSLSHSPLIWLQNHVCVFLLLLEIQNLHKL